MNSPDLSPVSGNLSAAATPVSYRRIIKGLGGYSVAMLLQRMIGFFLLPLYTHYLRPSDYGVLELLDLVGNVSGLLLGVRLGQAVFYYYFHAPGEREQGSYISTAYFGAVLLGAAAAAALFPVSGPMSSFIFGVPAYGSLLRVFLLGLAASFPVEIGFCYLRVRDRSRDYTIVSTARLVAAVVLNVYFLAVLKMGLTAIVWTTVITNVLAGAWMTVMIFRDVRVSFSWRHLNEMFRYSLPLGVSGLGEFLLHFGDRIFLRPNVSLAALGLYGLAYKFGMLVAYASAPFYTYWNAQMVGIVRAPGGERVYARTATYVLLGLTYITLLLAVFAHPIIALWTAPDYAPAATFIPWIGLAYVIRAMGSYFLNTFLLEKRSSAVARITWLATIVCLGGYALLVPRYKLWGAVIATTAGFTVIFIAGLWESQRFRHFDYEYRRWAKIAVSGAVIAGLHLAWHPAGFWPNAAIACLVAVLFPLSLILMGFLDPGERQSIRQLRQLLGRYIRRA